MKVFIGDNFYQPALVKIKDLNYGGNSVKVSEAKEAGVDLKDVNTEEVTEKEEMKEEVESKYSGLCQNIKCMILTIKVTCEF